MSITVTHPRYQDLRIVFMGTPEFAVASLDALLAAGCQIVGVVTAPDKPAGRGMKMTESAVKTFARERGLNVLQPEKLRNPEFLDTLRLLKADLQVVVAFRMLPEIVWNMPPLGTINLHGSLLPKYRGAAPINWAIINGETETGVTTFRLKHEIDTGNILLTQAFPIGPNDTAGEVHDRMKIIGAQLLVKTIKGIADGSIREIPQGEVPSPTSTMPHAPKIFTDTCRIDFHKPAATVHNLIRGLSPFPGAFTTIEGKMLKVFRSELPHTPTPDSGQTPGTVMTDQKTYLHFQCLDGPIAITELQLEGKRRMTVHDFLRGYHFK